MKAQAASNLLSVLGCPNKSMVGQLLGGSGKFLQILVDQLDPCFQLRTVCHSQLVAFIMAFEPLKNVFVPFVGTVCRTSVACPCRMGIRYVAFCHSL
jgi:hypothetical protein